MLAGYLLEHMFQIPFLLGSVEGVNVVRNKCGTVSFGFITLCKNCIMTRADDLNGINLRAVALI